MNRNITKIGSVLVCMAFGCLSLTGQEKVTVKMSAGEAAPGNEVDLRSWLPILADSSITYSANGTKVKRVYYDDNVYVGDAWGLYEEYVWENNQWSLLRDSVYFGQAGLYYNEESGSFTIPLHEVWWIRVPMPAHAATTRDENNRLISVTGKTAYFNFSVNVVYNANGKPVSVEEYITSITDNVGGLYYSSIYAYDAGGNLTFFEDHRFTVPTNPSWVWSDEFTAQKYSAAYDSEGRILNSKIDKRYDTGTDWSPEEYTLYYYSESSGTPGVETGAEAWSYGGALHVRTPQPLELTVHTMTGSLVRRQTVGAGETVLPLPQGMYIVHVGGTVKKIAVR